MGQQIDFFLGANTAKGFESFFSELTLPSLYDRLYVIKGGPGTGKSGFMRTGMNGLADKEGLIERIHCASDPDSLDAVIYRDLHIAIADGTPPHAIEPGYPGAFESIINLCDMWDEKILSAHREEIISANDAVSACHRRCRNYIGAAGALLEDNYNIALNSLDCEKVSKYAKVFIQKEFPRKSPFGGKENKRLLSAVTPQGFLFYSNTVKTLCDRVYLLRDDYGAAANLLLSEIREHALAAGLRFYSCWCPLTPSKKLEHLIFPSLKMGIVTANRFTNPEVNPWKVINYTRFCDTEGLKYKKQRLAFNRKASAELLTEALQTLKTAKQVHDKLETYYIQAMDYKSVDKKSAQWLDNLKKMK